MMLAPQRLGRSARTTHHINASGTTGAASRVVHVMPRLPHHNSAQLISTGTTMSSCIPRLAPPRQREAPTPTPILPPILMQVENPPILTKPGPYSAQGPTAAFGLSGSVAAGLPCFGSLACCAKADD